jgi:hypothetical protein
MLGLGDSDVFCYVIFGSDKWYNQLSDTSNQVIQPIKWHNQSSDTTNKVIQPIKYKLLDWKNPLI